MANALKQILTFGAAGRIDNAAKEHEGLLGVAKSLSVQVERRRLEVESVLGEVVAAKMACLPALRQLRTIAENLGVRQRELGVEQTGVEPPELTVSHIDRSLGAADLSMSAAKGVSAGISTALGAWALAGAYGTASTGTAIASLYGVAAQNATLAWFSGGSLAAGGGGVAGGAAVLGGVVAVPALIIMAFLSHSAANKQIAEIEGKSMEVVKYLDDLKKLELVIGLAEQRARELMLVLAKAREAFEHRLSLAQRRLYPLGWLSRAWKWVRKKLGLKYFKASEVEVVQDLLHVASEVVKLIDRPVFESDGSVTKEDT